MVQVQPEFSCERCGQHSTGKLPKCPNGDDIPCKLRWHNYVAMFGQEAFTRRAPLGTKGDD